MGKSLNIKVDFGSNYHKKLGLNGEYSKAIDNAVSHAISEAENICKREAPIDTGNLRRSIHALKQNQGQASLVSNVGYWAYVQYGTSKQSANPFVTRTANKIAPKLKEYVREELANSGLL